jgi:hypothetical protein
MIDINKKYKPRNGKEVRIYATDGNINQKIHGAINIDGKWEAAQWYDSGFYYVDGPSYFDLVEVKHYIKRKVWINVYPGHCTGAYYEKRHADEMAAPHRIGCVQVEIDCEEGEGL